jgi:hypothetical protein
VLDEHLTSASQGSQRGRDAACSNTCWCCATDVPTCRSPPSSQRRAGHIHQAGPGQNSPVGRRPGAAGAGDGNDSPGKQRAEPPGRPDQRDSNAQKDRAGGKDKPSKGKDKGKDKGK